MRRLWRRLRYILHRTQVDAEIAREIEVHRDMIQRDLERRGLPPAEAADAARRTLGSVALARAQVRDVWIAPWLQSVGQDVRFAARLLARHRSVTLVATAALGLGISVNSTMFAIVNAYCLRGQPIDDAARVVFVTLRDAADQDARVAASDVEAFRDGVQSLASMAAFATTPVAIADPGRAAERVMRTSMSASAFPLIGRPPQIGRDFRPEDEAEGAPPVVILAGGLWQARYGGDPRIIGRLVRIDGTPATVIGVMPEPFAFPGRTDVWQPLRLRQHAGRTLAVIGRLAAGKTVADARAELETIAARLAREHPDTNGRLHASVVPINEHYSGRITDLAWISFMTAGVLVVLIACANVANLLLMRSASRSQEIAIRVSLGATGGRILRQVLIESAVLAALGGALGLGLAVVGLRLFISAIPPAAWPAAGFAIDGRVLAMLALVCLGTVFVFGMVPARTLSRLAVAPLAVRTRRWTAVFLAGEVALTMILLAHVSWNVRSILDGRRVDTVIDTSRLLTLSIGLPPERYPTRAARLAFHEQLQARLHALPSVTAVATTTALPFGGAAPRRLAVDGRPNTGAQPLPTVWTLTVGRHYFDALRLPILDGRAFTAIDGAPGHERAIVNQRFVDLYFRGEPAIGRRIQLRADQPGSNANTKANTNTRVASELTIVGVSANLRQRSPLEPDAIVYLPFQLDPPVTTAVLIRTTGAPASVAAPVRDAVRQLDADLPVDRVASLEDAISAARWNSRLTNNLIVVIAGIALLLSMVGLSTLTAHAVAQRTREIGIRVALGAGPRTIAWLILRRALRQLAAGLIAGIACTLLWARLLVTGPRVGTSANLTDPLTLAPVALLIAVVALAACLWPARRASRGDPVTALRFQ